MSRIYRTCSKYNERGLMQKNKKIKNLNTAIETLVGMPFVFICL